MTETKCAIAGLEATQATQFYQSDRHLDQKTAETDSAVPLINGKRLTIRVYADAEPHDPNCSIDGELWFRGKRDHEWRQAPRFPGRVPAQRANRIDRGNALHSLNYRIDGESCEDEMFVRARVWSGADGTSERSQWHLQRLSFTEVPPLPLRVFGVRLEHPNINLAPPSAAEMLRTLEFVRKTFPIPEVEILSYEPLSFAADLCSTTESVVRRSLSQLLVLLTRLQTANLSTAIHFALLPAGVPDRGYLGFGSARGVAVSFAGNGAAAAQEIGHALQLSHAPGGRACRPDQDYPAYGSYPPGSIGEYGFDAVTGHVQSPKLCCDLMGYGKHHWISPYTYRRLMERLQQNVPDRSPQRETSTGEYLHVRMRINENHECSFDSVLALSGAPMSKPAATTDHQLELRDGANNTLSTHSLNAPAWSRENEHAYVQSIPMHEDAKKLVVRCCGQHAAVVHDVGDSKTQLELDEDSLPQDGQLASGILNPRWQLQEETGTRLIVLVRYSCDGGETWRALNPGLKWNDCRIDLSCLPGGDDCRLEVITWSEHSHSVARSRSFRVDRKPRCASIATEVTSAAGRPTVQHFGAAHGAEGFAPNEELVWTSSRQGILGHGSRVTCYDLDAGEHVITLRAPDGIGGWTTAKTSLQIP